MEPAFSISESIKFGWEKVRTHSALVLKVILLIVVLSLAERVVQSGYSKVPALRFVNLLLFIANLVVNIGATIIILKLSREETASFSDVLPPWRYFWRSALSLLLLVLIFLGCALVVLVVGGIVGFIIELIARPFLIPIAAVGIVAAGVFVVWLGLRYSMIRFIAVDVHRMPSEGLHIVEILRQSAQLTKGARWQLLLFGVVMIALNILGAIALLIGLLISIPITYFASTYVYLKLSTRAQGTVPA